MIDTGLVVHSDCEAKTLVSELIAKQYGVGINIISNCITGVTNKVKAICDGEDIYIVHKVTKSNKDKLLYVHFAYWML